MSDISFITEAEARRLLEREVKAHRDKGFVTESDGVCQHGIYTGRIAYETARIIIEHNPHLENQIDPDVLRAASYVHDLSKIDEGDRYHEVGTAYLVLTEGDTKLGLVQGGSEPERKEILKEMASLIPPDSVLYEELGKDNFPEDALYKDVIDNFIERVNFLRKELSRTDEPLTMKEFALPFTLNQQILLYADLKNLNGEEVSVEERMSDIDERYSDPESDYFNPIVADLIREITPRLLVVTNTIENLMR